MKGNNPKRKGREGGEKERREREGKAEEMEGESIVYLLLEILGQLSFIHTLGVDLF
jgi:hypothetical protein